LDGQCYLSVRTLSRSTTPSSCGPSQVQQSPRRSTGRAELVHLAARATTNLSAAASAESAI